MYAFLNYFLSNKKYTFLFLTTLFISSLLFTFIFSIFNTITNDSFFVHLFSLSVTDFNQYYKVYIILSLSYIGICTYLSTSYLGFFLIAFLVFIKGIQLSFSFIYVLSTFHLNFTTVLLFIIEIQFEAISIIYIANKTFYISLYVCLLTFFIKQNFDLKNILDYHLNSLIFAFLILFFNLALRFYIIPLF